MSGKPTLDIEPIAFTYFDDFLEFLWDYVCTEEPLITGVVGDAEALIFSSLRHVPVAVSVESSAVLRGGWLAGVVPDRREPAADAARSHGWEAY